MDSKDNNDKALEITIPNFSGEDIGMWKHIDKNDNVYWKVQIKSQKRIVNCFKVQPRTNDK